MAQLMACTSLSNIEPKQTNKIWLDLLYKCFLLQTCLVLGSRNKASLNVITHPERFGFLYSNIYVETEWLSKGQFILGIYRKIPNRCAPKMAHVIASPVASDGLEQCCLIITY